MTAAKTEAPLTGLALLRQPFAPHQISKLPKPMKKREDMDKLPKAKCAVCGGYHATSMVMHLDYVGHAALTDRLLDTDINWSWEPVAFGPDGLPATDRSGGMWIKLTVLGVTRLGYGSAEGKTGGDAVKEIIGDALRNAAMRFGAALDLWHKGDLHLPDSDVEQQPAADSGPSAAAQFAADQLRNAKTGDEFKHFWHGQKDGLRKSLNDGDYAHVVSVMKAEAQRFADKPAEVTAKPADDGGDGGFPGDTPFDQQEAA